MVVSGVNLISFCHRLCKWPLANHRAVQDIARVVDSIYSQYIYSMGDFNVFDLWLLIGGLQPDTPAQQPSIRHQTRRRLELYLWAD